MVKWWGEILIGSSVQKIGSIEGVSEMKRLIRKTALGVFFGTYVLLLISFLWPYVNLIMPFGPIHTDIAKRIESPDGSKTALLIRRQAFDLNFWVKIKEKGITKTIHFSRDFIPDSRADWNEKIVWSNDSSLLVLMVDDVQNNNEKYMWAYDFKDKKEYFDKEKIVDILNLRNNQGEDV
ncbi:MAG: hypothetical protein ACYS0I_02130 [Planctomycetota bacterium]